MKKPIKPMRRFTQNLGISLLGAGLANAQQNHQSNCDCGSHGFATGESVLNAPAAAGGGASPIYQTFAEAVPAGTQFTAAGIPILNSNPSAEVQIYLQFDGDAPGGAGRLPIDFDGDATTFNAYEQQWIYNWWYSVTTLFSGFDLNITTVLDEAKPRSWNIITPSVAGGGATGTIGYQTGPFSAAADDYTPYSFALSHEVGHTLGLGHQIGINTDGKLTQGYYGSPVQIRASLMGLGYSHVNKFFNKSTWGRDFTYYGEVEEVVKMIKKFAPASSGYKADDFANDTASAVLLQASDNRYEVEGIIENATDADVFKLDWAGGRISFHTTLVNLSSVNLKVSILDASGNLISQVDNGINLQWLQQELAAGTYYVKLESADRYGDIGMYRLFIESIPDNWNVRELGHMRMARGNYFNSSTNQWHLDVASEFIGGGHDRAVFAHQKLDGDGEIVGRVVSQEFINAGQKAGVMIRESLDGGARSVFCGVKPGGETLMVHRSTTDAGSSEVAGTASHKWVKVVRAGNQFTTYSSADGVTWVQVGTETVTMNQQVYVGIVANSNDYEAPAESVFADVVVTGSIVDPNPTLNALQAPSAVAVGARSVNSAALSWAAVPGATGYTVEVSENGADYTIAGTTNGNSAINYTATGLRDGKLYFLRVRADDGSGSSVTSTVAQAKTRAGAVTNLRQINYSTSLIALDWDEPFGETGFRIERSIDGVTYEPIGTVDKNIVKFVDDTGVTHNRYYYKVVTLDADGDSESVIIRRDADPFLDEVPAAGGVESWFAEVNTGLTPELKMGSMRSHNRRLFEAPGISGDATYEFIVDARQLEQKSLNLLNGNGYVIKFEQWNNQNKIGITKSGTSDWTFTPEANQTVVSPYGQIRHVVVVCDTVNSVTKLYVDAIHVGTLNQSIDLSGGEYDLGQIDQYRTDGKNALHGFAAYNGLLSEAEITAHKTAWYGETGSSHRPTLPGAIEFTVAETATSIDSVVATDQDAGQTLTYSIVEGNDDGVFAVDSAGAISVVGDLNYEAQSQYSLIIQVTDDGSPALSDTTTVAINVTDVDESGSGGLAGWEDYTSKKSELVHHRASALPGNTTTAVDLSSLTGDATFEFIVNAEDAGQAAVALLTSNSRSIRFEQWNNSTKIGATHFGSNDWNFTAESGQSVSSPYGVQTHMMFVVDTTAAETRLYVGGVHVGTLNHVLDLASEDGVLGDTNLRSDSASGIIGFVAYNTALSSADVTAHASALDVVANQAPVANDAAGSVVENGSAGTAVATVSASDPDAGDSLSYAITAGNGSGLFAVDSNGNVTTTGALDFESASQHVLTVTVTDGSLSDTAQVTVNTTNVNESPTASDVAGHVDENGSAGAAVVTVPASDPDAGSSLSYTITAGNAEGLFAIDSSGNITATAALDFENASQYALTVTVSDGALSDTSQVSVNVNDVNEDPVFAADAMNRDDVLETRSYTGQTLAGSATDVDAGTTLAYSKTAGPAWLNVASDGALSGTPSTSDLGANVFTVQVSDGNGGSDTAVLNIDVLDKRLTTSFASHWSSYVWSNAVDGDSATFAWSDRSIQLDDDITVEYGKPVGPGVIEILTGDPGNGGDALVSGVMETSNDGVTWTNVATISGGSAQADLTEAVKFVRLRATAAQGTWLKVREFVLPTNAAPVATNAVLTIAESSSNGSAVGTVTATDANAGDTLSYAITAGNDSNTFAIDANGNVTTTAVLDFETTAQYVLTVTVTDDGTPAMSDTATITVDVSNVNEAPLAINNSGALAEDAAIGTAVATVVASDVDAGDSLSYAITAGNTGNAFAIDSSGQITTATALDYETLTSYNLTVTVTDSGSLTDTATVSVTVTDIVEVTAPAIATGSASNLSMTTADLGYSVSDDGGESPTVTLYYGETDGGSTPANWTNGLVLGAQSAGAYSLSISGLTEGTGYYFTIEASNTAGSVWGSSSSFATTADTSPKMARTTVSAVSSSTWTNVNLGKTYNSAVIVATPIYADSTQVPVVTRLRNVSGSSFDLKIDRADGLTDAVTVDVSVIAIEEGVYTLANDGVKMEAVKFTSTVTGENNSWSAEARTYQNNYTTPVVVGQVMSANDSNWSTFWSMGSSRLNPADASNLNVGKHVGEDANAVRSNETIGYIVIESGNGSINGVNYTAAVGSDIVRNYENSALGYSYSLTGLRSASAAALSSSGMDGTDGAWPVLNGVDALSSSSVKLIVDEDQIKDSEQKHATEQINYLILE